MKLFRISEHYSACQSRIILHMNGSVGICTQVSFIHRLASFFVNFSGLADFVLKVTKSLPFQLLLIKWKEN